MKNILVLFFLCLPLFCIQAQPMKCMTYNIRYDNPGDGPNRWDLRKDKLAKQILFFAPDILGIQEALLGQVTYLQDALSSYAYLGVGRDDGQEKGEFAAIFYVKSRYAVKTSGHFWLSETPEIPSKSWDAALPRICTYALFEHKETNKRFWVFNTHYDHKGVDARNHASEVILQRIKTLNAENHPVILMGDLNAEPLEFPIQTLSEAFMDSYTAQNAVKFGPEGTYNNFRIDFPLNRRIDYIFLSREQFAIRKYAVLSEIMDRKFLSDHLPVFVEVSFMK